MTVPVWVLLRPKDPLPSLITPAIVNPMGEAAVPRVLLAVRVISPV